jgi:sporulation protein YlmC with PRC-barrel domain
MQRPFAPVASMRLDLECPVDCADDPFGELADVVIDPRSRRVTHLVVQPHERHDLARLVPIGRAHLDLRSNGRVSLDLTVAQLNELEPLHDSEYILLGERPDNPSWDVGVEEISAMPLSGSLGVNALGAGMEPIGFDPHGTLSYDRIPKGTVEIRRESEVTSSDGHHVGHVVGFVIDEQQQIAQLVVEHGHLWGKREIEIPVTSIDRIESDEVVLALSNDEVAG